MTCEYTPTTDTLNLTLSLEEYTPSTDTFNLVLELCPQDGVRRNSLFAFGGI